MNVKSKSNKQFMILSAFAIIFVVDAHAWSPLAFFTNFFPYNSFFMPLFVFVSGYFYREKNLEKPLHFLLNKAKSLLVPYYAILLFVLAAVEVLREIAPIGPKYGELDSLKDFFINPFYKADLSSLLTPGWFVPALFCVLVIWVIVRCMLKRIWNDSIAAIAYCVIGTFCVYLSRKGWNETLWLPLIRTGFLLQFYQLGVLYCSKLEHRFRKIPAPVVWLVTLGINALLQYLSGNQIYFNDINKMTGFLTDIYVLPLITSVTGIAFWLVVADKLAPILGNNKLINYISNHTYAIMMFHIIWFNVYNFLISRIPAVARSFDFEKFYKTAWYRYEPVVQLRFFYVIAGLLGTLMMCWLAEKLYEKILKRQKER